jgi:hypothetical protein
MLLLPEDFKPITVYYAHLPQLMCLVVEHPDIPEGQGRLTQVDLVYTKENGQLKLVEVKIKETL